eukprot:1158560-Pelagomonas_calceolata.AAC.3
MLMCTGISRRPNQQAQKQCTRRTACITERAMSSAKRASQKKQTDRWEAQHWVSYRMLTSVSVSHSAPLTRDLLLQPRNQRVLQQDLSRQRQHTLSFHHSPTDTISDSAFGTSWGPPHLPRLAQTEEPTKATKPKQEPGITKYAQHTK